jgi:hypothetical protein
LSTLFILYPAVRNGQDAGWITYLINNKRFAILSAAKDLLYMLTSPVKFAFKANLLFLTYKSHFLRSSTAGNRFICRSYRFVSRQPENLFGGRDALVTLKAAWRTFFWFWPHSAF